MAKTLKKKTQKTTQRSLKNKDKLVGFKMT